MRFWIFPFSRFHGTIGRLGSAIPENHGGFRILSSTFRKEVFFVRALVIYYSLQGNTRFIAKKIAQATKAEILELSPLKDVPSKGFLKYILGGKAALSKQEPPLNPLSKNPQEFDLLFLGTPVWGGTHAPAWNTLFREHPFFGKELALFCCHGGGKGKVFTKMEAALPKGNHLLGCIDFCEPLKKETSRAISESQAWGVEILKKAEQNPN